MKPFTCFFLTGNQPNLFVQTSNSARLFLPVFIFFIFNFKSSAQCDTFINADAANPVLSVLPSGETITSLDFVDIDGDGNKDVYIIPSQGFPQLYLNTGTPKRPEFKKSEQSGFENVITPAGSPVIQFADIDGDSDFDCFITEVNYGFRPITAVRFYRNTGTSKMPRFEESVTDNPVNFARTDNNYVQFYLSDVDNDGDVDFYYTGFYNRVLNDYDQYTYLNKGTAKQPDFVLYTSEHPHDFERQRTYFDWNKDGLTDYVKFESNLNVYEYQQNAGPVNMPLFSKANHAPVFTGGMPFRIVDLNNDSAYEAFTANGHYSTIAPVAVINTTARKIGSYTLTKLVSANQSSSYKYRWQHNGKNLPFGNQPFVYAVLPGRYVLYVTSDCGTGVSLPFVMKKQTGISNIEDKNNTEINDLPAVSALIVKAYPNPFTSAIQVQLPSSKTASTIRITDLAGRTLLLQSTSTQMVQVGKNLPAGTYILQVIQGSQVIYYKTIVKE